MNKIMQEGRHALVDIQGNDTTKSLLPLFDILVLHYSIYGIENKTSQFRYSLLC
jgi:hypothetical protein